MFKKIVTIIGGVVLVIAVVAAVGLGVWSNQLNTRLTSTQKQLASLHNDYDKLKTDNAKLITDLSQANSTLDQTKSDLSKAKSDLKAANNDKTTQRAKLDKVKTMTDILEAFSLGGVNNENAMLIWTKVISSGDTQLIDIWNTFAKTPTQKNGIAFFQYIFDSIDNELQ